jgi:hypothetical protein
MEINHVEQFYNTTLSYTELKVIKNALTKYEVPAKEGITVDRILETFKERSI